MTGSGTCMNNTLVSMAANGESRNTNDRLNVNRPSCALTVVSLY
jgi:hypothetical protein